MRHPTMQGATRRQPSDAIIHPDEAKRHYVTRMIQAEADLAAWVEYYWIVRWDVDGTFQTEVMPQPRVHLAEEDGVLNAYGIMPYRFFRTLRGRGHVIGVAFRPGGFSAFMRGPVAKIQGREVPANTVLRQPVTWIPTNRADDDDALVSAMRSALLAQQPEVDPIAETCGALVQRINDDRSLTRSDQVAAVAGVSVRTLQRWFGEHVGTSPKWVIQRSRILDAVADCHHRDDIDWPELASGLGFADQAHFINVFRAALGTTPAAYLSSVRQQRTLTRGNTDQSGY